MPSKRRTKGAAPRRAYLHSLWAKAIKERDGWRCVVCGVDLSNGGAEASHHIPRGMGGRNPAVACHMDNGSTKCHGCHRKMDTNPLEHADFIRRFLGEERYENLKILANNPPKMTNSDKQELAAQLREIAKNYRARRAAGEMGRFDR